MVMKFLADENIASSLVKEIRKKNFNIKDIKEEKFYGISDNAIIEMANNEDRIILTHDKDFVDTLCNSKKQHKGVVLLKFKNQSPKNVIKHFIPILSSEIKNKFKNSLVIISEDYIKRI